MTVNLDVDNEFDRYNAWSMSQPNESPEIFHTFIFVQPQNSLSSSKNVNVCQDISQTYGKVQALQAVQAIKPMEAGASGGIKVSADWGGKEGTKISISASGEVHDDNGNYVEAEIKQDSNGQGSANVSAGTDDDKK